MKKTIIVITTILLLLSCEKESFVSVDPCMTIPVRIEIQYDAYMIPESTRTIVSAMLATKAMYAEIGIELVYDEIYTWVTKDPYGTGSSNQRFKIASEAHWQAKRDVLNVVIGANPDGVALLGNRKGIVYAGLSTPEKTSWTLAHEIGHALGCSHMPSDQCDYVMSQRDYAGSPCKEYPKTFLNKEAELIVSFVQGSCDQQDRGSVVIHDETSEYY